MLTTAAKNAFLFADTLGELEADTAMLFYFSVIFTVDKRHRI